MKTERHVVFLKYVVLDCVAEKNRIYSFPRVYIMQNKILWSSGCSGGDGCWWEKEGKGGKKQE